jgi:hypothetical protein
LWSVAKVSRAGKNVSDIAKVFGNQLRQCKYALMSESKLSQRVSHIAPLHISPIKLARLRKRKNISMLKNALA